MQSRVLVVAVAAGCAVVGIAGCSSGPAHSPQPPGSVPVGTAQVTINGQSTGTIHEIKGTKDDWMHTIITGDDKSGVKVVVDTGSAVTAKSVVITNVGDFTGSMLENQIGKADATMIGSTFRVNGTAEGASTADPNQPTSASFEVKANC